MNIDHVALSESRLFSDTLINFLDGKENLKPFYHRYPEPNAFKDQILEKSKKFSSAKRGVLTEILLNQYQSIDPESEAVKNIHKLREEKTFTLTTGHQLNIFTGPLYFHYKIITVINAAKKLKQQYPDYDFVPVYWMASEDHDYDEIKSVKVEGQTYTWNTDQTGAVGRFDPEGLSALAESMPGDTSIFVDAYSKGDDLAEAVRLYVHRIYGDQGLVVLDADESSLKNEFIPVIKDDIFNQSSKKLVDEQSQKLEEAGYSPQIHAREINFFYLEDKLRERIISHGEKFHVNGTSIYFSREEMETEIEKHPEKFSPNVILRPVYQEIILPNLSYSGGPAEVVYWLQLKTVFEHYDVPYPILLPRNFCMVIDHTVKRTMDKCELSIKDTFTSTDTLINEIVKKFSKHDLSLENERKSFSDYFREIRNRAEELDTTLVQMVESEARRAEKSLNKIEKKFLRSQKRQMDDKVGQVESIRAKLFPNEKPQERVVNFLDFYSENDQFINQIMEVIDPFCFDYHVITLDGPKTSHS